VKAAATYSYIVITPARNESANIGKTIDSMLAQTVKPLAWVIVDDGSTDGTAELVSERTRGIGWITLLSLPDRGYYDLSGGAEIKAFYKGFATVSGLAFDFISKLDGDVSFGGDYYERLLGEFTRNTRLGIASGAVYYQGSGMTLEKAYRFHVRGAARVYRRACWERIGGTPTRLGWDASDVYHARMLGWNTEAFEHIPMIHHVKTWTKGGLLKGRMRAGKIDYVIGSHFLFVLLKVLRESMHKPLVVGAVFILMGYLKAAATKEVQVGSVRLRAYIRRDQLLRMLGAFGVGRGEAEHD
jgi:biofilm PGA synthesis N-glycosyltransferase PgaC